jgi:hypothetical protein
LKNLPIYAKKKPVNARFEKFELNSPHPLWRLISPAFDLATTKNKNNHAETRFYENTDSGRLFDGHRRDHPSRARTKNVPADD